MKKLMLVVVVFVFAFAACSSEPPIEEFQEEVRRVVTERYAEAGGGTIVRDLNLVHVEGVQYRGIATVYTPGAGVEEMIVTVTRREDDGFMFEVKHQ